MAIFSLIGAAIAGALFGGSTLAASLIGAALAFGTKLAISYLTRPKKRTYTAVQGETQYGGDVPVGTIYGTSKVRGQRIFYAKYGSGNKFNTDVFVLANGWCDGLEPVVYFYGKKYTLIPRAVIGGEAARYETAEFGNNLSFRFYDGRPGQVTDAKLVSDSDNLGQKWKATSRCTGLTYVIIDREWDDRFDKGKPEFDFVLRGLREYDPRKDSTVAGGSGPQRVDDPTTWVHTNNPAVHRLNYQLGLRALISQRVLIGEGKTMGQLDLGTYVAAMNVCDTVRLDGKKRYQCSLYVSGEDDHTEILREFDDAMAGYTVNRRGLSGVIPGAPQIPVLEITADDIPVERAQDLQRRKSSFDLINHLSGQFTSIESDWNPESLTPIYVNADVAADKRQRQTSNDFLQVTDPDLAQYLLTVRYRQNRKAGSATVPVSRRVGLAVQEGEWVTFEGINWLITGWEVDEQFRFTLRLSETGADVYSDAAVLPGPVVIPPTQPVNPSLLTTVQNFNVEVGLLLGIEGYQAPTLRFTWTPPADPTILAVRFFFMIEGQPTTYQAESTEPESGEFTTSKDVQSGLIYVARATITTRPDRFKTFTPWVTTAQATGLGQGGVYDGVVGFPKLKQDVQEWQEWIGQGLRETIDEVLELATEASTQDLKNFSDKQVLRREVASRTGQIEAGYKEAIIVATGPGSALVQRIETLEVTIPGLATVSAVDALTVRVDTNASGIVSNAAAITSINNQLPGLATVTALNALTTRVTDAEGDITANANAITALQATVGDVSAEANFRMEVTAGVAGYSSRIAAQARVGGTGAWRAASWFLDVPAATGSPTRFAVVADQFIITDGTNNANPFIFSGGVARMNMANIGTVTAGVIRSADSKFVINLANKTFIISD